MAPAEALPWNALQEAMVLLHVKAPERNTFLESITWQLHGALDVPRFHAAWQAVVDASPVLR